MNPRTLPGWLFSLLLPGPAWAELSFQQVILGSSPIAYERDVGDIDRVTPSPVRRLPESWRWRYE